MQPRAKRSEVAREAGVSESTVSRALNDSALISAGVKDRVKAVAQRLGYVPSQQAALFARKRTLRLGFVVRSYKSFPPFSRAYFPALLDGAVLGADEKGYSVAILLDKEQDIEGKQLIHAVRSQHVDGLLIGVSASADKRLHALKKAGIPLVLINNYQAGFSSVDGRPDTGTRRAFEHAVELGHKHIGYIGGDMNFHNAEDRLIAFKRIAEEFKLQTTIVDGDFSRRSGYMGAAALLQRKNRPTLIMTACDREALGVLNYCRQHRINVPEDVGVIGYDNLDPAKIITPALTTIDSPVTESGRIAAHILIKLIERKSKRPIQKWLDSGFVVRESTAAAK
jgi:LacI family transcriptional regulator